MKHRLVTLCFQIADMMFLDTIGNAFHLHRKRFGGTCALLERKTRSERTQSEAARFVPPPALALADAIEALQVAFKVLIKLSGSINTGTVSLMKRWRPWMHSPSLARVSTLATFHHRLG